MSGYQDLIPVNVVTGFLGSGKTTLLRRLLAAPSLKNTAVLVNEFGEVGLDHQLLQGVAETALLLENGCVCCAIRGDLQLALKELYSSRSRGEVPAFDRVVVETSGLADPVPVAFTVLSDPVIQHHYRLGNVTTTVDAVNGESQLRRFEESRKQAAIADRLIITKTDLLQDSDAGGLRRTLRQLNPAAEIIDAAEQPSAEGLLIYDAYVDDGKVRELEKWRDFEANTFDNHIHDTNGEFQSFSFTYDQPLDWTAFGIWASMLLNRHGEQILRLKALLNVAGLSGPVAINGVQHIIHPPTHLGAWIDDDHRSRIVFIVRDLSREQIAASLAGFNALANPEVMNERQLA